MRLFSLRQASRLASAFGVIAALSACGMAERTLPLTPGSGLTGEDALASANANLFRMAQSAANAGDRRTAIGIYQQLASNNPDAPDAWYGLGNLLLAEGSAQGSADAFAQILRNQPEDPQATIGYARAMMALGRPEAAAAHLEPLLEREPENLRYLNLLAVVRDLQGDHSGAMALYRKGLVSDPESVPLRNNMALSAALAGDSEAAIQLIRPVAEGLQSSRQTRQNLALVYGLAGNFSEAERISRIDLDNEAVANNLAYFAALRAMAPSQIKSAVLRPDGRLSAAIGREQNESISLGIASAATDLAVATSTTGRWFLSLGEFDTAEAASAYWRRLRNGQEQALSGLQPLAVGSGGSNELIIGRFASEVLASEVCSSLADVVGRCVPVEI